MGEAITLYDRASAALAAAVHLDDVMHIRDEAERLKLYARQAKDKTQMADACELHTRAERRLGELLTAARAAGQLAEAHRPKTASDAEGVLSLPAKLSEIGVDRKLSARAQRLANLTSEAFEDVVREVRQRIVSRRARIVLSSRRSQRVRAAKQLGFLVLGQDARDFAIGEWPEIERQLERQLAFARLVRAALGTPVSTAESTGNGISDGRLSELARKAGLHG